MGEVYRAEDTRLGREVAIKVLPAAFVADPDRVARFEREARVLASLTHPSIASIYEVGRDDGTHFLVMELAQGETLADRIARGALPPAEALPIALQIAEALEAAHERGIVHRDLKPANVMVDREGRVKLLDFGLARALEVDSGEAAAAELADSPTLTRHSSLAGALLGTAAYMSPEQAGGSPADRRADVWAFGVLLFEMLAGRAAFGGESLSHVLAAVLKDEPPWSELPPGLPARLRELLRRCLRKPQRHRLQAIGDARVALEELLAGREDPEPASTPASPPQRWSSALPWAMAALAAAGMLAMLVMLLARAAPPAGAPTLRRLTIAGISVSPSSSVAISPDGREIIAYDIRPGSPRLLRRRLDGFEVQPLPSGQNAFNPFFSPDGASVGFISDGQLCVAPLEGTGRRCLAAADGFATGAWGRDGTIVVSHTPQGEEAGGLLKVAAAGGEPAGWLTRIDRAAGERVHAYPQVLPDAKHVLFSIFGAADALAVVPLAGGPPRALLAGARRGRWVASGHLVYEDGRSGVLRAVPFDLDRLSIAGESAEVLRSAAETSDGAMAFDVSEEGTLVYSPAGLLEDDLNVVRVDRAGRVADLVGEAGAWTQPRVAPDGASVLLRRTQQPDCHIWLFDLGRKTLTRLTAEGDNHDPHWLQGGAAILFSRRSPATRGREAFSQPLDGGGADRLFETAFSAIAVAVAPGDRHVAVVHDERRGRNDILVFDRTAGRLVPFATSDADEDFPDISPDGRFVAFSSNETGRPEVYVQPLDGRGRKLPISVDGGTGALWSRDGRELFYTQGERLMRVAVTLEPGFAAGAPEMLFADPRLVFDRVRNYDVMPDGQSFVMVRKPERDMPTRELRVVTGWFSELERLAPRRGTR
jgi:eukaryotic-like serine/threonine-protein kinase